jgi:hypothetical protein
MRIPGKKMPQIITFVMLQLTEWLMIITKGVFGSRTKWNVMSWFHSKRMGWFHSCVQFELEHGMGWFRSCVQLESGM